MIRPPPRSPLFPYPPLFGSLALAASPSDRRRARRRARAGGVDLPRGPRLARARRAAAAALADDQASDDGRDDQHERSEEHTSELQSQSNLVCRLLLETKSVGRLAGLRQRRSAVRQRRGSGYRQLPPVTRGRREARHTRVYSDNACWTLGAVTLPPRTH